MFTGYPGTGGTEYALLIACLVLPIHAWYYHACLVLPMHAWYRRDFGTEYALLIVQ